MKFPQKITLDLTISRIQNVRCSQDDDESRKIVITLSNNGARYALTDDVSIYLKISKPDKTYVYIDENDSGHLYRNDDDGTVTIVLSKQSTMVPGIAEAEFQLINKKKKEIITSRKFNIIVERSVVDNDEIVSGIESNVVKDMIYHMADYDNPHKMPDATFEVKGITQLTDSVASNSTTTAATPNSVKTVNDALTEEKNRATVSEDGITSNLNSEIARAKSSEQIITDNLNDEIIRAKNAESDLDSNIQIQLNTKAPLASPALTGTPKAPTASAGTNTTQIATTAFVQTAVSNHNTSAAAHSDIRDFLSGLTTGLNALTDTKIDTVTGDTHIQTRKSGTTAEVIHRDAARTDTTSAASPASGETFTAIDSVISDSKGHVTKVNTKTVTLPNTSVAVDSFLSSTSANPVQNKVVDEALNTKLSLTGGSMSGYVTFSENRSGIQLNNGNYSCHFEIGTGGINRGIYDVTLNRWMVYSDDSNSYLKGNADTATKIYSTLTNPTSATTYYIPFHSGASSDNKSLLNNDGLRYHSSQGTASANGLSYLMLGNSTGSGTAENKSGVLRLYTSSTGYININTASTAGAYTITLPASNGTVALTGHTHNYLPLTGGTLTGTLCVGKGSSTGYLGCYVKNSYRHGGIHASESGNLGLIDSGNSRWIIYQTSNGTNYMPGLCTTNDYVDLKPTTAIRCYMTLRPETGNTRMLGTSSVKWKEIWCNQSSINSSSDRNIKKDIAPLDDKYDLFYKSLNPVSYKFIDGTSNRTHIGFISQDVEDALISNHMTALDFAGFCKDIKMKTVVTGDAEYDENGNIVKEAVTEETEDLDANGDIQYNYALRYSEFIALNTYMIQKQQAHIEAMERKIEQLEKQLA